MSRLVFNMPFRSKRSKAIRDARQYGALIDQYDKPYALLIGSVIVDSSPWGGKLYEQWLAEAERDDTLIYTAESGQIHHFAPKEVEVNFKHFKGTSWVFYDVTLMQSSINTLQNRVGRLEADIRLHNEVFEHVTAPIWIQGDNNNIYFKNKEFEDKFTASIPKAIQDIFTRSLKNQEFLAESHAVIVNGERRHLRIKVKPLSAKRALLWAPDRTELVETIEARDRLLNAQRELLEQIHTAVSLFDQNTCLRFYNSAFAHIWGLEESYLNTNPELSDILEKLREARMLPEQADFKTYKNEWMNRFTELLKPLEEMAYLPDGRTLRQLTLPNPEGGLFMIFEDVTNTLELESSVNTLLAVQRETLDNMIEAMAVFGADGRIKLWNPQYARLWNLFPEELKGDPHISSIVDDKIKQFDKKKQKKMKELILATALNREDAKGRFIFENGRHIEFIAVPLPDGATLLSYNDVTDAQNIRRALQERAEALEAAEQLKLDFLANMSYQLRNPLNSLLGFSELLEQQYFGELNDTQLDYTKNISTSGRDLLKLIDEILDVATLEAGYMELKMDTVDVTSMIDSVYLITEEWARKSLHDYKKTINIKDISIQGDERRIKQALINLIRNAINFTPRGGEIELGVEQHKKSLRFWVKDNGVGIPIEDQDRVLKAFERLEDNAISANAPHRNGAGLGLTLVHSIVELHGGQIDLVSTPSKGTKITITLPL